MGFYISSKLGFIKGELTCQIDPVAVKMILSVVPGLTIQRKTFLVLEVPFTYSFETPSVRKHTYFKFITTEIKIMLKNDLQNPSYMQSHLENEKRH